MTRTRMLLAALVALMAVAPCRADFDRRTWSRYRNIDAAPVTEASRSGKAVSVELPEGIAYGTHHFGDDLRVIDQAWREVPYVLRADQARPQLASATSRRTRTFPVRFLGSERDAGGKRCSIRFELSLAFSADRLIVIGDPADFAREARLYRETPAGEALVAGGTLHGQKDRDGTRNAGMAVSPLERGRYRLEVEEGDSPPLRPTGVSMSGPQMSLVFRPASTQAHFLFHGQPGAKAPVYDLERILSDADIVSALPASLGPEMSNADFAGENARKALPDRYPWIVRGAAILVALLLGSIAWRALKKY